MASVVRRAGRRPENVRCADESLCDLRCRAALAIMVLPSTSAGKGANASRPTRCALSVGRLDLERYRRRSRELTRFGDPPRGHRRQPLRRWNWIEAQLRTTAARRTPDYVFTSSAARAPAAAAARRLRDCQWRDSVAGRRGSASPRGRRGPTPPGVNREIRCGQPDSAAASAQSQPTTAGSAPGSVCTKSARAAAGDVHPSGHMDGLGLGEAPRRMASGRPRDGMAVCSAGPTCRRSDHQGSSSGTRGSGLNGAQAYIEHRAACRAGRTPPRSGRYPGTRWLGIIQHDMLLSTTGCRGRTAASAPSSGPKPT